MRHVQEVTMDRLQAKLVVRVLCLVSLLLLAGSAAFGSLLFDAILRNGDYGGGVAVDTMDPDQGGSPHVLGISNSGDGVMFTPTETTNRSNALINWELPSANRNLFRQHGTVSMWVFGELALHSTMTSWGALWGENYGFDGYNHGQGAFSGASSHIANGEGTEDDRLSISWSTWHNSVWYYPGGAQLEYGRWYHLGFAWGGPDYDYEFWVDGELLNHFDLPDGVTLPWGMEGSGTNWGLGDNHQRGYDAYGSNVGIIYSGLRMWDEYRAQGDTTPAPETDFTATPTIGYSPLTVDFTDTSTGSPSTWAWDFGDGGTSTEQNPSHVYDDVGTYPVTLVAENVGGDDAEVKTHFVHVTFPDVPFEPTEYWALHQVLACVDAGVVQGYWDGYHPEESVTRAQMAVYISRALAEGDAGVTTPTGPATFADVPTDYWAFRYVEYCKAQDVVAGYWDGYHPEEGVTRAQMAVYVARSVVDPTGEGGLAGYTPPVTATFPDVAIDYWAYKHIEYCKDQSIVSGYWDGYHPEEAVTRAQMAVYVARAFGFPM
jgi:PKD repeat protein